MVLQVLLASFLWLLSFQGVASCLQCDPHFLKWVASLLKETLPGDLPNRDSLITQHIQALADLHGTFLRRKYERILGVTRRRIIFRLRFSLRKKIRQILEKFADLAVIEGPVLDCWTCLRITTQCFDGEVCGGMDGEREGIHTTDQVILSNSSLMMVLKFIVKCNYSSGIKTIQKTCGPSFNRSVSSARRQQFIKIVSRMGRVSENVVQLPQTVRCKDVIQDQS
uniref:Izumo sperm-egg fusion protein 3 n=1 Tax=Naja naja TaxID=35670 RepID=A0A8C6X947_NAJNA